MIFSKQAAFFAIVLTLFFVNPVKQTAQTETAKINELISGTKIQVKMDNEINSQVSSLNDTFTVTVAKPVSIREVVVLPIGAVIEGRITNAQKAETGGKNGEIDVLFEKLTLESGTTRDIEAVLVQRPKAKSSQTGKILSIIGGAALGGLIGALTKVKNGALIGAGIGVGAGTGTALLQKGKDVRIQADETFEIRLTRNVTLPAKGF